MSKYQDCDFRGWATRNDVLCSDGRTIRQDAFKDDDGKRVPIIWGHQHYSPESVLGHGYLETRPEGVYFYGYLNDTPMGKYSKTAIKHGDITSLSIWADNLVQNGGDVLHGSIKEVSLVLAGANRKACIEFPYIAHGDDIEENMTEAYIWMGDDFALAHSDLKKDEEPEEDPKPEAQSSEEEPEEKSEEESVKESEEEPKKKSEELAHKDSEGEQKMEETKEKVEEKAEEKTEEKGKTIGEIFNGMTDEQKMACAAVIGFVKDQQKAESSDKDEEKEELKHSEGGTTMQYNAFANQGAVQGTYLSHSDEVDIINNAKKLGKLSDAIDQYASENTLAHDDMAPVSGFTSYPASGNPAGVDALFPEWHDVRPGAPEIVTEDQAWVKAVLNKVHRSPYSRIRTSQVDLRNIETIRAKGYVKGTEKLLAGNYNVARRTTAPQTVYVKSALNRDDVVDITDFDYVDYQYKIDRMQLEKELARAILIGDGRADDAQDKIFTENIRPIWGDNSIFTITKVLDVSGTPNGTNTAANFGASYLYAQAMEEALLDAKIDYRGSGALDMFCDQAFYNKMLLAKDLNGRRLYNNKNELKAALEVNNVYNVPEFNGLTRTEGEGTSARTYKLLAIFVNLGDYTLGATKGGEITHFTDFDIDFNQLKSLLETRVSGANTRILSAIVIEEEVTE